MKLKDFLTKLKADGKITQAEFLAAIESAPDWDFPEKAIEAFEASFLTPERAATDKTVHSKLKREFLDPLDNDFKKILTVIDGFDKFKASEIDKIGSTYEKSAALTAYLPQLLEKIKGTPVTDEETKKELKKAKDTVQELMGKIETINTDTVSREKHWQKESEEKINGYRLRVELEKRANSIKFGKAYSDEVVRKDITKGKLDKLIASKALQLVEKDGQDPDIQVIDVDGKPRFNGNSAVTINQLLEDEFKVYIKANNSGDDGDDGKPDPQVTKRFNVPDGKQTTPARTGARTTVS